jgi:PTS system mannose-specific IIA component
MISVIVVMHGDVGTKLVEAAEAIAGKQTNVTVLGLAPQESLDNFQQRIGEVMGQVHTPDGVLILADMWGGTPCNASLKQCQNPDWRYDVVTGVNLPMLVTAFSRRAQMKLEDLAQKLVDDGPRSIQRPLLKIKSAMSQEKK